MAKEVAWATNEELSGANARLKAALEKIDLALKRSGRPAGSAKLTAVTKQRSPIEIENLILAGQTIFGENRVQEAASKWPALKTKYPNLSLRLIGPLQSNKVRNACSLFDAIETLDRPSLAAALASEFARTGAAPELYVQVNIGQEPQKAGVSIKNADQFIKSCRQEYGLIIAGLMCIPPIHKQAAPFFALLADIAHRNDVTQLSMGMSADYEIAVQLGATRVRLGAALFQDLRS
jgi:pyridoxal phosphate enzyme (YggS family)